MAKVLRKSQGSISKIKREKLRNLRLRQNDGFLIKKRIMTSKNCFLLVKF